MDWGPLSEPVGCGAATLNRLCLVAEPAVLIEAPLARHLLDGLCRPLELVLAVVKLPLAQELLHGLCCPLSLVLAARGRMHPKSRPELREAEFPCGMMQPCHLNPSLCLILDLHGWLPHPSQREQRLAHRP